MCFSNGSFHFRMRVVDYKAINSVGQVALSQSKNQSILHRSEILLCPTNCLLLKYFRSYKVFVRLTRAEKKRKSTFPQVCPSFTRERQIPEGTAS